MHNRLRAAARSLKFRTIRVIPLLTAHGASIPAIGFGTSQLGAKQPGDFTDAVATALKLGYRHIDTAWKYGSEPAVGNGIKKSGVPRKDIFLTTKVSHEYLRAADFARSVEESLSRLQTDRSEEHTSELQSH